MSEIEKLLQGIPKRDIDQKPNLSNDVNIKENVQQIEENTDNTSGLFDGIPSRNSELSNTFKSIPEKDPDKTAKIMNVSREIEEPEDFVQENLQEIEEDSQKPTDDDWREVENEAPVTANFLKDTKNMALAHDDVEPLKKTESIFKELRYASKLIFDPSEKVKIAQSMVRGQVPNVKTGFTSGALQVRQSQLGWKQMTNALSTGKHTTIGEDELNGIEKRLSDTADEAGGFNPLYFASQQLPNMIFMGTKAAERGLQGGLVFGLGAAALGVAGPQAAIPEEAFTVPAATMAGLQVGGRIGSLEAAAILEGGAAYRDFIKMKDKNGNSVNPRLAAEMALAVGVANAGLEYVSLKALMRTIPGGSKILKYFDKDKGLFANISPGKAIKTAAKNYLVNIGTEVVTEIGQESVTSAGRELLKKLDPKLIFEKTNFKSILADIAQVISPTIQASMLLGAPGTITTMATEANKMNKTELNKEVYDILGNSVEESKLLERSPEAVAKHINDNAEQTEVQDVIISKERFDEIAKEIGLEPQTLASEIGADEYYQSAAENDTEIVVPTGLWVANTKAAEKRLGKQIYSSFSEDVKFKHDEYTAREKKEIGEFYQNEFSKEADKLAKDNPEVDEARKAIYDQTLKELIEAGTKKKVAEAQAQVYTDMVVTTTSRVKDATIDEVAENMVSEIVGQETIDTPGGELAQFAGLRSTTADTLQQKQAAARLSAGQNAETIRQETGWFQGKDKKWRYEITDDQANLTFDTTLPIPRDIIFKSSQNDLTLSDLLKHDQLYRAYPWLEKISINYEPNLRKFEGLSAYYHPGSKTISVSPDAITDKKTIMHEIQHAIQDHESFEGGQEVSALVQTKEDIEELENSVSEMEKAFSEMAMFNDTNRDEDINIYKRMGFLNKLNRDKAILEQVKQRKKPTGEVEAGVTGDRTELTEAQRREQAPSIMFNGKDIQINQDVELFQRDSIWMEKNANDTYSVYELGENIKNFKTKELAQNHINQKKAKPTQFNSWFSDSKVVDDEGNPLVVYHGTKSEFEEFDPSKIGELGSSEGKGFYFSNRRQRSESYTGKEGVVKEVYLSIQNPITDIEQQTITKNNLKRILAEINKLDPEALSNYGDVKFEGLQNILNEAVEAEYYQDGTDLDLIASLINGGISNYTNIMNVVEKITGYDGVIAPWGDQKNERKGENVYVAFKPEQIKSVDNRGTFDPADPNIFFQTPVDTFYSRLDQVLTQKMPASSNKQQILGIVKNAGVKQEEIDWIGLPEFLDANPKVTKQQVLDFVKANNPDIQEVAKVDGITENDIDTFLNDEAGEGFTREEARDYLQNDQDSGLLESNTKFDQYTLPGGENYKETLMRLPVKRKDSFEDFLKYHRKRFPSSDLSDDAINKIYKNTGAIIPGKGKLTGAVEESTFSSQHFDEPNILAHVRTNERVDSEGNKVLMIEEIQSDWHQAGRQKGYKDFALIKQKQTEYDAALARQEEIRKEKGLTEFDTIDDKEYNELTAQLQELSRELPELQAAVPDAPFKKTWHELALKRMVREAAEKGFDKIAWTTGEQQAERYDLSKQVDNIIIEKEEIGRNVKIIAKGTEIGFGVDDESTIYSQFYPQYDQKKLDEVVGKELAKKIMEVKDNADLSGTDLKVGGEGMKGFYDKIIPNYLKKFGKKYGAKVEKSNILEFEYTVDDSGSKGIFKYTILRKPDNVMLGYGKTKEEALEAAKERINELSTVVHSMEITPQLKDAAMLEGFPLFQDKDKKALGKFNALSKKITLAAKANPSTFMHEMGHAWLEFTNEMAQAGRLSEDYQKDWDTVKTWLEIEDGQTKLTTDQQEKFARGFESYLQDGKAPKVELISAFAKFKSWLMRVYSSVTHPSHGLLSKSEVGEDVQKVMARMFATDEEIKASEYYLSFDKDLEMSGIDPKVREKMSEMKLKAHEKAFGKLMMEQMKELTTERKQEIETFRTMRSAEIENELRTSDLYKSIELLNTWKKTDNIEQLNEQQVQAGKKYRELATVRKMADKYRAGTLDDVRTEMFDIVADSMNYYSGEELATQIVDKRPLKEQVEKQVNEEIAEKFKEAMNSDALRDMAMEALHNDNRLELMALEHDILKSMVEDAQSRVEAQRYGQTKAWIAADIAKQKAESYLSNMKISQLGRISKYITAERNYAIKSLKAMQKKDFQAAADYKQKQMINHALATGIVQMQKKLANVDRQFNKIVKKKREKFIDQETYSHVQNILNRFGLTEKTEETEQPLLEYIKRLESAYMAVDNEATPVDVAEWVIDEKNAIVARDMTFTQYQEVLNTIKNIMHVSNNMHKFYNLANSQYIAETIEQLELVASKNRKPRKRPRAVQKKFDQVKNNVDDYLFSLEQIDTVLGRLDGWDDFGPWQQAISQPTKDAADFESKLRIEAKDKLKNVWIKYDKKELKNMFDQKLIIEELGVTKDNPITKQQLISMALNLGNETNRDRLFDTVPVGIYPEFDWSSDNRLETEAIVTSILEEHLEEKDWQTVQDLWDVIDSYWPSISKLHKEITGFEPGKVEGKPLEITLPNGKRKMLSGGYYPLVGDPRYSEQIAVRELTGQPLYEEMNPAFKAMTKTGHTKARTNAKYAVSLNLDIVNRHLNDVIHDLAFRPVVFDLRRLSNNVAFQNAVKKYTGDGGYRYIKQWVGAIAAGGNTEKFATDVMSRTIRWLNNRQTFLIVVGRTSILLQNFANVFMAPTAVKGFNYGDTLKGYVGRGLMNYWPKVAFNWKAAGEMRDWVFERSTFMRDRAENPVYTLQDFKGVNVTDKKTISNFMIGLIGGTDDMTNIPLWTEAYTKKLDETQNEQEAVKFADQLVYRIVGTGRKYDVAKVLRGTDIEKIFTKFYSFWNVEYNNWVRELGKQGKEPIKNSPRFIGLIASRFLFIYTSAALAGQLPDKDEPDDKKQAEYIRMFATYPISFFPFAREIGTLAIDTALGLKTYGYRPSPAASLVSDITRTVATFGKAARGEGNLQDVMESVTKIAAFSFKIPYQIDSWFWNAYDAVVNGMEPSFRDIYKRRSKRER